MIDTVKFRTRISGLKNLKNWKTTVKTKSGNQTTAVKKSTTFTHKRYGIKVTNSDEWGWDVQASLARVLFDDNRKLISNQRELDQAQTKLAKIVSEGFGGYQGNLGFLRVDLCWYIQGVADHFIRAHQDLELPESKGGKVAIYMRESITWETKCERKKTCLPNCDV